MRAAAVLALVAAALAAAAGARAQTLGPLGPLGPDGEVPYFIAEPLAEARAKPDDPELAAWALEAWERAAAGALKFVPAEREEDALVRVHWVAAAGGQYGEMRPFMVGGRRGAAVYIRPDMSALDAAVAAAATRDPLFRDAVVYLTCLHELGHALGLSHTAEFEDVMYFFGFGGDIGEFFGRYRRTLRERDDIRRSAGLSAGDVAQLKALYGPASEPGG